jgi:hypothetical protein
MGDELLMRVLGIEGQDVKRASDATSELNAIDPDGLS